MLLCTMEAVDLQRENIKQHINTRGFCAVQFEVEFLGLSLSVFFIEPS